MSTGPVELIPLGFDHPDRRARTRPRTRADVPGNAWSRFRDLAFGTAIEVGDAARLLLGAARWGVAQPARHAVAGTAAVQRQLTAVVQRGVADADRARVRAAAARDTAILALATSKAVDIVVDAQLERVLRPVVRGLIDEVLGLLQGETERVQEAIRGQRDTMADELVGRIRSRATANGRRP